MSLASVVAHSDEETWHAARRPLATATQVRDWAKGYPSDRAALIIEKITGVREDLAGIKYIEWGKFREPFLQDWIQQKYGIAPVANDLYVSTENPHWGCTPDGHSDAFGVITLSEIKTTSKDLHPDSGHYLQTGYDDQMQWEMLVTGAAEVLFVWEQHNDVWEPWPEPYPPKAVWIKRDDRRIEILKGFAEELLAAAERWQAAYDVLLAKCVGDDECRAAEAALIAHIKADHTTTEGLEDRWLFTVGGDLVPEDADPLALGVLPEDVAELAEIVVAARAAESDAKKRKEEAWKKLQAIAKDRRDFKAAGGGYAVGWSTSTGTKKVIDVDAMRAKAPSVVARYESLQQRFTRDEPTETHTLTVTHQDS